MAKTVIGDAIKSVLDKATDVIADYLKKHPDLVKGVAIGAFLGSKAGRALITSVLAQVKPLMTKVVAGMAAEGVKMSGNIVTGLVKTWWTSITAVKGGKSAATVATASGLGDAAKWSVPTTVTKGLVIAEAAAASGYMIGSYLGYTIGGWQGMSASEKALRIIFPQVYMVKDAVQNVKDSIAEDQKKTSSKALIQAQEKLRSKIGANIENINYRSQVADEAIKQEEDKVAKEQHMVERPKEGTTAETMWRREVERRMKYNNDPAWYKAGKLNGIQYANEYNFDTKKGAVNQSPLPKRVALHRVGLPTVASMRVILSMGRADQDLLENMFTDVTIKVKALNKNSALTTSWNKLTLFKLIHTMRVAYALWNIGKNCYKLVNEFDGADLTLPYSYFAAMGMDIFTWQVARAQIQEDLKFIGGKMDTYIDFTKLDLFKRTEQMFTSGYADSKSLKGQRILFSLDPDTQYYNFQTNAWTALGNVPLYSIATGQTGATYAAWKNLMNTIIDSLINSTVIQDLLSCLRFVFGTGKTNLFEVPDSNDRLKFVWNPEVMAQIENSTPVNITGYKFTDNATGDWTQDNFVNAGTTALPTKRFYNGHQAKISKDEQIVASRLMVARLGSQTSDNFFGTEIPTRFVIVAVREAAANLTFKGLNLYEFYWNEDLQLYLSSNSTGQQNIVENNFQKLALLSCFDWAPILDINVTLGISGGTATDTFGGSLIADWDNFAVAFDTTIDNSLTWMSYIRNGNYSLYSHISTRIDAILDAAKTA